MGVTVGVGSDVPVGVGSGVFAVVGSGVFVGDGFGVSVGIISFIAGVSVLGVTGISKFPGWLGVQPKSRMRPMVTGVHTFQFNNMIILLLITIAIIKLAMHCPADRFDISPQSPVGDFQSDISVENVVICAYENSKFMLRV